MKFKIPLVKKVYVDTICRRRLKKLRRKGLVHEIPDYVFYMYYVWYEEFVFCIDGVVDDDLFFNDDFRVTFCHSVVGRRHLQYNSVRVIDYINTYERRFVVRGKYNSLIIVFKSKKEATMFKLLL